MTLKRPTLQHDTGAGHDPASTVAQSAAALAANRRLEELRRSAGVNYRQPGAGDNRAWLADLAGAGDKSAASTVEADPVRASTYSTIGRGKRRGGNGWPGKGSGPQKMPRGNVGRQA